MGMPNLTGIWPSCTCLVSDEQVRACFHSTKMHLHRQKNFSCSSLKTNRKDYFLCDMNLFLASVKLILSLMMRTLHSFSEKLVLINDL